MEKEKEEGKEKSNEREEESVKEMVVEENESDKMDWLISTVTKGRGHNKAAHNGGVNKEADGMHKMFIFFLFSPFWPKLRNNGISRGSFDQKWN